jgi:hypothetical protein
MKRCLFCNMDVAVDGFDFCSLECARWSKIAERLLKLEGILIEIKYEVKKSNQIGSWEGTKE